MKLTKSITNNLGGNANCNMSHDFGFCLSGLTGHNQSSGLPMWENRSHNCDICIKCAQANRFIEMIEEEAKNYNPYDGKVLELKTISDF